MTKTFPKLAESEILHRLSCLATEKGVYLTVSDKIFFVALVSLFEKSASFDEKHGKYLLQISNREYAVLLEQSKNFTNKALCVLHDCGAIERVPSNFYKLNARGERGRKPYITYLNLDFLIDFD